MVQIELDIYKYIQYSDTLSGIDWDCDVRMGTHLCKYLDNCAHSAQGSQPRAPSLPRITKIQHGDPPYR